jgi:WD40 repeat protein
MSTHGVPSLTLPARRRLLAWIGIVVIACTDPFVSPYSRAGEGKPAVDHLGDPLPAGAVARLGTRRLRFGSPTRMAFSPDGKTLGFATYSDALLIDPRTGKEMRRFKGGTWGCLGFAFLPDGKHVLAAAESHPRPYNRESYSVGLWEIATGKLVRRFPEKGGVGVWDLSLSADGKVFAMRSRDEEGTVTVWEVGSGKLLRTLPGSKHSRYAVALSPDGKRVAVPRYQSISLHEVATGKVVVQLADVPGGMWSLVFSPDGTRITGGNTHNSFVYLWDAASGRLLHVLKGHKMGPSFYSTRGVAFSADGKLLYTGGDDRTIRVWDVASGKQLRCLEGGGFPVAISPDGKTLASGSSQRDWCLRLWDAETGKPRCVYDGHRRDMTTLAYAPDSKVVATGGGTGRVHLWDVATGKYLHGWKAHRHGVTHLLWSPDGKTLFSVNNDKIFWNPRTGRKQDTIPRNDLYGPYLFHPTENVLIGTDSWTRIRFRDLSTGKDRLVLENKQWLTKALAITRDGKRLAICRNGEALQMWDLTASKSLWLVDEETYYSLAFSPDGRVLYFNELKTCGIAARRTEDGKELFRIPFEPCVCLSLALSGDGRAIVAIAYDPRTRQSHLRLIETASGRERRRYQGHAYDIRAVAFAPKGRTFTTVSSDCTGLVWDALSNAPIPKLTANELWQELASEEAGAAHRVMAHLLAHPGQAIEILGKHLEPARPIPARERERLISMLVDDHARARQVAKEALRNREGQVETALLRAARAHRVAEVRQAAAEMLDQMDDLLPSGDLLRQLRAIEVLEHLNTKEARDLLDRLARGDPQARQTREAAAGLERGERKPPASP